MTETIEEGPESSGYNSYNYCMTKPAMAREHPDHPEAAIAPWPTCSERHEVHGAPARERPSSPMGRPPVRPPTGKFQKTHGWVMSQTGPGPAGSRSSRRASCWSCQAAATASSRSIVQTQWPGDPFSKRADSGESAASHRPDPHQLDSLAHKMWDAALQHVRYQRVNPSIRRSIRNSKGALPG